MSDTMPEEGFLRRWSRLKSGGAPAEDAPVEAQLPAPPPSVVQAPVAVEGDEPALPTLADAANLTPEADFSAFVGKGVDKAVQRLALKTLFSDPHFKLVDGLDVYMHDFNQASPVTLVMLASLQHAQGVLARLFDDQAPSADACGDAEAAAGEDAPPPTQQGTA
ncbi:DUF3306 domain-containing protein [Stenotrophomonas indicatrix]|uniref:DUF3306 domain-containing protein n=1 Tax=Stenotrophomonas indicatrix TaxID=2045451 RepID=UPI003D6C9085